MDEYDRMREPRVISGYRGVATPGLCMYTSWNAYRAHQELGSIFSPLLRCVVAGFHLAAVSSGVLAVVGRSAEASHRSLGRLLSVAVGGLSLLWLAPEQRQGMVVDAEAPAVELQKSTRSAYVPVRWQGERGVIFVRISPIQGHCARDDDRSAGTVLDARLETFQKKNRHAISRPAR